MEIITIEPTNVTPYVLIDPDNGTISFKGRSSPQASTEFYNPIIEKIRGELVNKCASLTANFELEYFNTSSSKCLYDILKALSNSQQSGNEVIVNWCYEDWDDDMRETGEDYEEILGLKFNYITVEE